MRLRLGQLADEGLSVGVASGAVGELVGPARLDVAVDQATGVVALGTTSCARQVNRAGQLRAMCKERLRRYEYPHVVHFVDELPRTPSGKVQRFKLREVAADGAAQ